MGGTLAVSGETSSIGNAGTINSTTVLRVGRGASGTANISAGAAGMYGIDAYPTIQSTASGQNQYGISASVYSIADGTARMVSSIKNIYIPAAGIGANVTVTNAYGLYVEAPTVGGTNTGIYNAGTLTQVGNGTFTNSVIAANGQFGGYGSTTAAITAYSKTEGSYTAALGMIENTGATY